MCLIIYVFSALDVYRRQGSRLPFISSELITISEKFFYYFFSIQGLQMICYPFKNKKTIIALT